MSERISIVVPIFNSEKSLKKCVNSIQAQVYNDIEIILVDDGSTDLSSEICDGFAEIDDRVIVIHKNNEGPVKARKAGIEKASGKYIGFVDADDYIDEYLFSRLHELIEKENCDFVHSGYLIGEEYRGKVKSGKTNLSDDNRIDILCNELFGRDREDRMLPSIWSKLFKANVCKKAHDMVPEDLKYGEDLVFLCNCLLIADSYYSIDEAYYHYMVTDESLSHVVDENQIQREILLYHAMCNALIKYNDNNAVRKGLGDFLLEHIFMGLNQHPKLRGVLPTYVYPRITDLFGKRLVLFGAGKVGCDYYMQIRKYSKCQLVAWLDNDSKRKNDFYQVGQADCIKDLEYDCIVVAVNSEIKKEEIKKELEILGINKKNIIWEKPRIIYE